MNAWEMPQVQALGEERLRLMQEAAEKCRGKSGMERLDIFLEYGEKLSEGGPLAPGGAEGFACGGGGKPAEQEQKQLTQLMQIDGNLKLKKSGDFSSLFFCGKQLQQQQCKHRRATALRHCFFLRVKKNGFF